MGKAATFLMTYFLIFSNLNAQDDYIEISAWEPEDITLPATSSFPGLSLRQLVADRMLQFYQKKVRPNSIRRCPFYIPCSDYARQAIEKYGLLLGISVAIDRYFYRENSSRFWYYGLRKSKNGLLKLDDSFFLYPEIEKSHLQTSGSQHLATNIVGSPRILRQYSKLSICQLPSPSRPKRRSYCIETESLQLSF